MCDAVSLTFPLVVLIEVETPRKKIGYLYVTDNAKILVTFKYDQLAIVKEKKYLFREFTRTPAPKKEEREREKERGGGRKGGREERWKGEREREEVRKRENYQRN